MIPKIIISLLVLLTMVSPQVKNEKFAFETVEVDSSGKVAKHNKGEAEHYIVDLAKGVTLDMVKIPGGSFLMGSNGEQSEQFKKDIERYCSKCDGAETAKTEIPQHKVTVQPFYMGRLEITQAQWKALMTRNPSNFKKADLPVENISWNEAVAFCKLLSKKTGQEYRLPTEAEWEYACRAGSTSAFSFGDTINTDLVNYDGGFPFGAAPKGVNRETTTPPGSLGIANAFGLYDMHGNIYEWCMDTWHENYDGAPTDGSAWTSGGDPKKRVLRGGAWDVNGYNCRSAYRIADFPDRRGIGPSLGFRVVSTKKD